MNAERTHIEQVVHVRFEGRSRDIPFSTLDVGGVSNDQAVRTALARYFDVPERKFAPYVIERHTNGNMTVRPEAVFGLSSDSLFCLRPDKSCLQTGFFLRGKRGPTPLPRREYAYQIIKDAAQTCAGK